MNSTVTKKKWIQICIPCIPTPLFKHQVMPFYHPFSLFDLGATRGQSLVLGGAEVKFYVGPHVQETRNCRSIFILAACKLIVVALL